MLIVFFKAIGYHFELFAGMIFAEKSAAVTKQHWPHVLKSVRDPFDCRASLCTVGSSQIWGWFKTILIHFVPYFEGMNMRNIHSPAILLGSPWDPMMAWVPAAIRMCDALYVWICQEPLISRSHLLGRMVGAEDLNPTAKWLNWEPVWRLSRLGQVEHGPSLPQIFRDFKSLLLRQW